MIGFSFMWISHDSSRCWMKKTTLANTEASLYYLRFRIYQFKSCSQAWTCRGRKSLTNFRYKAFKIFSFFPRGLSIKCFQDTPCKAILELLLSHFSRVWPCATPYTAAHQAPLSLGFSRQEHWSGLPFPSPMHESEKWKWSCSVVSWLLVTPWTAA